MPLAIEAGSLTWAGLVGGLVAATVAACIGGTVTLLALWLTLRSAQRSRDSERLIDAVAATRTTTLKLTRLLHGGGELAVVRATRSAADGELLLALALARRAKEHRLSEVCKVLRDRLADQSRAIARDPAGVTSADRTMAVMTGRTAAKLLHEWLQGSSDFSRGSVHELVTRTSDELARQPWSPPPPWPSTRSITTCEPRQLALLHRVVHRLSSARTRRGS